uniref:Putative solute carrier family 35 member e3 isoform x1 n=1 Tax=Ixodes scapularis TaxID=6945 RepID=A0A4D5RCV1_IXOSC
MAKEAEKPSASSRLFISFCLVANVSLAIFIVILNKWVYVYVNFPNITMTMYHFLMTFVGLLVCRFFNMFQVKTLPIAKMLPLAVTFCGFVVFTNLSLGHNTVGTYQILKTLTMPTIMVIQYFWYSKTFSFKIKLTLWVGEKQKEFQVNSMQLLFYQAPLSALLLLFVVPIVEPPWAAEGFLNHHWTLDQMALVFLTGLVAFLVNLSIYWIIGNTSAVTYNVVGHTKVVLILAGGFIVFQDPLLPVQGLGLVLTLCGVFMYTHFKLQEQKNAAAMLPMASSSEKLLTKA